MADTTMDTRISALATSVGVNMRALRQAGGAVAGLELEEAVEAGGTVSLPEGMSYQAGLLLVWWNGLALTPGVNYTESTDGTSITIQFPAQAGDSFLFRA